MRLTPAFLGISRGAVLLAGAICGISLTSNARASETASATISEPSLGGGEFDYTLKLTDTGTTNVGTFWYSGCQARISCRSRRPTSSRPPDGLPTSPTPAAPTALPSSSWPTPRCWPRARPIRLASRARPRRRKSRQFPFHTTEPVDTSFIYSGAPFSDAGFEFQVTPGRAGAFHERALLFRALAVGFGLWRVAGRWLDRIVWLKADQLTDRRPGPWGSGRFFICPIGFSFRDLCEGEFGIIHRND